MLSLATYIEYQLMTRHFAFVPGIGAWMLRDVEACGRKAPQQEVFFNRFTSHDDGMTAALMMEAEGVTYDEATARIAYEAGQWITMLQRDGKVDIKGLGQLVLDPDQSVSFAAKPIVAPCNFGLEEVTIQTLAIMEEAAKPAVIAAEEKEEKVIVAQPAEQEERHQQLYWLQHVAACLLIVLGLFSASTGSLSESDHQRDYASMVDMDILLGQASPYTLVQESWDEYIVSADLSAEDNGSLGADMAIEAAISTETAAATGTNITAEAVTSGVAAPAVASIEPAHPIITDMITPACNGRQYYIIVASCATREEAQRAIERFENQGYGIMNILERDSRFRIYINTFMVKDDAESRLQEVRETTKFKDAWLLSVRVPSLSYIIKNTYNGNQLSMELPRLNTTAERDQG